MQVVWLLSSVGILLLPILLFRSVGYSIAISFLCVAPVLVAMLWFILSRRKVGISFATVTVFFLLFFYIAPIFQLIENPARLLNTMPVREGQLVLANVLSLMFLIFYVACYLLLGDRRIYPLISLGNSEIHDIFWGLLAVAVVAAAWGLVGIDLVELVKAESDEEQNLMAVLLKHKVLFTVPFLVFSLYVLGARGRVLFLVTMLLFFLVLATKNPFYDRRNSLGPVYFALILIAVPYFLHETRRYFLVVAGVLIIFFPLSSVLTHYAPSQWSEILTAQKLYDEIVGHFVNMHYDAWANFVATIDFVGVAGYGLGGQLTGSALFFFPRSLWQDKPIASGQLLGEYLSERYTLWFDNISCPLPAEGYIDFGVLGVIVFACALAWFTRRLDVLVKSDSWLEVVSGVYFSSFLLFVLRGSLLPAVAYGTGAYVAIKIFPFVLFVLKKNISRAVVAAKEVV